MTYRFLSQKILGPALTLICFGSGCSSTSQIASHWTDQEPAMNGAKAEWTHARVNLDDKGTSVGVFNDKDYLYFALITTNTNLQSLVRRQGLTLWFDPKAGEDKKFGIHYPVRTRQFGRTSRERADGDEQTAYSPQSSGADNLEICGPGEDDRHQMTKAEATGIDVRYRVSHDTLVYETKVPLADNGSYPFAIGAKTGGLIGIGVEAGGRQLQKRESGESSGWGGRRSGGPGGPGSGGAGFGGRGEGGEYGGHRGYRGSSEEGGENSGARPDPYKSWIKVQLATQDTLKR